MQYDLDYSALSTLARYHILNKHKQDEKAR